MKSAFKKTFLSLACSAAGLAASAAWAGPMDTPNAAAPRADSGISPASLARAQSKFSHAQQVASTFSAAAVSEGLPPSWHMELIAALIRAPESQFDGVQSSASARDALVSAQDLGTASGSAQPKALGDIGDDLTFIPLATPCRIVDTRVSGAGGPQDHTTRAYSLLGSAAQGSSACSAYAGYMFSGNPGAIAVNITVDASGYTAAIGSFLRAYPDGSSATTSWLNFSTGQVVANAGVLGINTSNARFDVFVNAPANVVVDVYGSFVRPAPTPLECISVTNTNSFLGIVGATCPSSYTVTGGGCNSSSIYDHMYSGTPSGNGYQCGFYPDGTHDIGTTLTATAQCCRVPGRVPLI